MDVDKPLKFIVPLRLREPCSRGRTSLWCAHCALLRNILLCDRTRAHAPTPPAGDIQTVWVAAVGTWLLRREIGAGRGVRLLLAESFCFTK